MSQNSGMGERSVVMCVVTPSMRLLGTAAKPIQRSRRQAVISSEGAFRATDSMAEGAPWGLPGCGFPLLMAVLLGTEGAGAGVAVTAVLEETPASGGGTGWPSEPGSTGGPMPASLSFLSPEGIQIMAAQASTMTTKTP